jgi:hypothetical protein
MEVVLKPALPHLSNPGNGSERQALFQKAEPPERESLEKLAEEWHLGEIGDRRSGSRTAVCLVVTSLSDHTLATALWTVHLALESNLHLHYHSYAGLPPDGRCASPNKIILDNIPAAQFHNGGRLRFGPDGMLYIGTGDAKNPENSQDVNSLAGKILRVTPEGQVPEDNPFPNNPAFIVGVRNNQGFDWYDESTLRISDHGPSGELGRTGHDEVNAASAGDNLGWPPIYSCPTQPGMIPPSLTWDEAVPPGGAAIYTGNTIPEWRGNLIIGVLGANILASRYL